MITVTFANNRDTRTASLTVKGHAGQAEKGHDIVCSAASILAYTVAQIVKAMEFNGDLTEPAEIRLDEGDAVITVKTKTNVLFAELMHTFFVAKTGYRILAHNYPKYVQLITDD